MLTVLRNIALEVLVLILKVLAYVLDYGVGFFALPLSSIVDCIIDCQDAIVVWLQRIAEKLEALKEK